MKRWVLALILLFFVLSSGCFSRNKENIFSTPFGEIEKGSSPAEVMGVLGNPYRIKSRGKIETWYYDFGEDNKLSVRFARGKMLDVKEK